MALFNGMLPDTGKTLWVVIYVDNVLRERGVVGKGYGQPIVIPADTAAEAVAWVRASLPSYKNCTLVPTPFKPAVIDTSKKMGS